MAAEVVDERDITERATVALRSTFPAASIVGLTAFKRGASSITYSADVESTGRAPTRVVVKVAPPGLDPVRNRDVLRQGRVLSSVVSGGVLVPIVFGTDAGDPPAVPPLVVMSYVDGDSFEPLRPNDVPLPTGEELRGRTEAAVDLLASLHRVDAQSVFPEEPVTTPSEEIDRWAKAFSTIDPLWVPTADVCEAALRRRVPVGERPAILHGDFRLGNLQCSGASVKAAIDWEIWSVGDPRFDLAWFCMMMDPLHPAATNEGAGLVQPVEIVERYESISGATVAAYPWFLAVTCFKQAAASALLVKHGLKRGELNERQQRLRSGLEPLLKWCLEILA
jgi:aminoglycoside phosphotransferase (APT) family kinase protein